MITVVQRVRRGAVTVADQAVGAIDQGLLLLVGVERGDAPADADATARKIAGLRCFPGRTPMDCTVAQIGGACLVVSQFTLTAELADGNRPSFSDAASPDLAEALYLRVVEQLRATGLRVATGTFGAAMLVDLSNDGPATFVLTVRGGRICRRRSDGGSAPTDLPQD